MEKFTQQQVSLAIDNAAARLGYHSIKRKQIVALEAFIADGKDVFVSAYRLQEASMLHSSALDIWRVAQEGEQFYSAVCITFKTSLMIDQREKFTASALTAEFVGEGQDDRGVLEKIRRGC